MRILLVSAHPYIPQIAGGLQSNTHELALELLRRGHVVAVASGLTKRGYIGGRARALRVLLRREAAVDMSQGYPVYRTWHVCDAAAEISQAFQPDVVIVQSGRLVPTAQAFIQAGCKTVIYLHNVEFEDHGGDVSRVASCKFISNSEFTRKTYKAQWGIESEVLNPLFQPSRYEVRSSRESVLFINPIAPKGLNIAASLARMCPDIPFDFVQSWTISKEARVQLDALAASLSNLRLHPPSNDMKTFYGRARVVLVPSQWDETWGRVASEAHFSGIPALASSVGGLVEAVGPGGILVSRDSPPERWCEALRSLWDDPILYSDLCRVAKDYSRRPQIDSKYQIAHLESIIRDA
jgi:glycosyltransferase involved in cell wall biosynthesis